MQDKTEKAQLRKRLLERRDAIPPEVRRAKDRSIHERLASTEQFREAGIVFLFASFRTEVDTLALIKKLLSDGKRVVLPKVEREQRRLLLYEIKNIEELIPGYMGIPEPATTTEDRLIDPDSVDVIVIPGAGYDLHGNRIGYGGGYYDRLLSGLTGNKPVIAPAYEEQIVDEITAEPHDIKVGTIVTDRRTIVCG